MKTGCLLLRHFKITHFRAVIVLLWTLDIFAWGYHMCYNIISVHANIHVAPEVYVPAGREFCHLMY